MQLPEILDHIVQNPGLHAKWLNTLSFMENAGARKISAAESREKVTLLVLKHAAEEARHAYYLKKQISKTNTAGCEDYSRESLLAPAHSAYYLQQLDIEVSRYIKKELGFTGEKLKFGAYLLVTYAIEVRADQLYPVYQESLTKHGSKVNVKSIITEEEGHLAEMLNQMKTFFDDWGKHAEIAIRFEHTLYVQWMDALSKAVS